MRDKTLKSWMYKLVLGKTTAELVVLKSFHCAVPFVLTSIFSRSGSCSFFNCARPSISGNFSRTMESVPDSFSLLSFFMDIYAKIAQQFVQLAAKGMFVTRLIYPSYPRNFKN